MRMGIKTSLLAIVATGAFCGSAMSAASVRSVGGTGTFASASSAAETSARAGSLRAGGMARPTASISSSATAAPKSDTPATGATATTAASSGSVTTGGTTSARIASTPRLSVGKYIGTPVSISSRSDGKTTEDLDMRLDKAERDISELETEKQDMLSDSEYISIDQDKNELVLDVDKIRTDLKLDDGMVVDIDADNDDGIKVSYMGVDAETDGKPQLLISWDDLKNKLDLGGMNDEISGNIDGLRTDILGLLARKVNVDQGVLNAGRVMQVNALGEVAPGNYVYSTTESDTLLSGKVNLNQPENKRGYALVVNDQGVVDATGDFYPKADVYNKTEINEIVTRTGLERLGDLAYKDEITNDDVAEDAAIARSKLAGDIVGVLDWIQWWNDNVPKGPNGEPDGHNYVLSLDENGNRSWFRVVVDEDESGGSVIEQPEG